MLRVRKYRPDDAAALASIFYRSVREVASRCYSQAQIEAWAPRPSVSNSSAAVEGRITIVAVDDADKPIAFGDMEVDGHVDHLYSSPEAVGTGAAAAIYKVLELHASQLGLIRLHCEVSECALAFFERHGYIKLRKNEFALRGVPIHNYSMEKFLK